MSPEPTRVAVAVIERTVGNAKKEILAGVRPTGTALAGFWEFPGGKLNANETFEQAVVRECQEETGLDVDVVGEFPAVTFEYDHATVRIRFFRCNLPETSGDQPLKQPFQWIAKSRLSEYRFPEANNALIELLLSEIER